MLNENTEKIVNEVISYLVNHHPGRTVIAMLWNRCGNQCYLSAAFRHMIKNKMIEVAYYGCDNTPNYRLHETFLIRMGIKSI